MRSKDRLITLILILISFSIHAQSPEIQARAAFLKAQELYGNGDYSGAIDRLDNVKELLGSTNPRVEYLLCQSHFANKDADKAESALKKYFELADASDPNYNQMLLMIEEIKARKAEFQKEQERLAYLKELALKEPEAWSAALEKNTRESYQAYLDAYPKGKYSSQASKKLRNFPPAKLYDKRSGHTYETVWIGDQIWMTSNLINPRDGSDFIAYQDRLSICPEEWSLPSRVDFEKMLRALGGDLSNKKYKSLQGNSGLHIYKDVGVFEKLVHTIPGDKKWQGDNSSGFGAMPKASIGGSIFSMGKNKAVFWTSSGYLILEAGNDIQFAVFLKGYNGASQYGKMPCRCLKEN